jgi:uncharacterized peroxidase-related enzyme
MPHLPLSPELPGSVGLFAFRPGTAAPLTRLAEALLRGPSSLSAGERELIAAHVSARNGTSFCQHSHGAAAAALLGDAARVDALFAGGAAAEPDPRLRALLAIAEAVAADPRGVTPVLVAAAREAGADDIALHDTVLIAAAFCMYNRYVDGLATDAPPPGPAYAAMGCAMAEHGYLAG